MTDTYKVLGQALTGDVALDNTTVIETIAYEVPAGTKASVSAIAITNSDIADQTYRVAFVPSTDVETAVSNVYIEEVIGTEQVPYSGVIGTEQVEVSRTETPYLMITTAYNDNPNTLRYTLNGYNWFATTGPDIANSGHTFGASGNGITVFKTQSGQQLAITSDLITYTYISINGSSNYDILFGNNVFFTLSNNGTSYSISSNGTNWTTIYFTNFTATSARFANGKFFLITDLYPERLVVSSNVGLTTTPSWVPASVISNMGGNNINVFSESTSILTWTIVYNQVNGYAMLAEASTNSKDAIFTSPDGLNWEVKYETPAFGNIQWLASLNNSFIIGFKAYASFDTYTGIYDIGGTPDSTISFGEQYNEILYPSQKQVMFGNDPSQMSYTSSSITFNGELWFGPWIENGTIVTNLTSPDGSQLSGYTFVVSNSYNSGPYGPVGATFTVVGGGGLGYDVTDFVSTTSQWSLNEISFYYNTNVSVHGSPATKVINNKLYLITEQAPDDRRLYYGTSLSHSINSGLTLTTENINYAQLKSMQYMDVDITYTTQDVYGTLYNTVDVLGQVPYEIPQSLNKHIAIYNKTISSGETHEIKGGITLSAGDQIRVYSDSAEIITNVYGVEIS